MPPTETFPKLPRDFLSRGLQKQKKQAQTKKTVPVLNFTAMYVLWQTTAIYGSQGLTPVGESEGGFYHPGIITHLKTGSTITEYSFDAWGRRRDKDDWSYTLTSEPALFADRGFTAHEFLSDFNLYNMNGRLYDPVVGRFLSPDPYIQDPSFSQSYNRYSYCLNNPLKFTDYSGEKWKWNYLNPFHWFESGMQLLNDKTPKLRQNMVKMGVPDFGVNYNTLFGTGFSVGENPAYYPSYEKRISDGQRNISNHLVEVRKNYGPEWRDAANGGGTSWYSIYNWPALGSSARTMDALYAGNYLEAGIQFATCAAEVFTFGYSSQITTGVRTTVGNLKVPVYRVYGDGATMYGKSYSLINPEYVPYYRNFAGLPDVNSGQYLLKGSIPLRDINVGRWFAALFPGNTGGLPFELYQNYNQLINPVNVLIKKPF